MKCEIVTSVSHSKLSGARYVRPLFSSKIDQGIGWIIPLFIYLLKNRSRYDTYIFTGGPFFHFILVPYIKIFMRKKVILDYRDPFSLNPVFKVNKLKKIVKEYLEILFNIFPDRIVTVNSYCAKLLKNPKSKEIVIIENGYDDRIEPKYEEIDFNRPYFLLTGSSWCSFEHFSNTLVSNFPNYDFFHIGNVEKKLNISQYKMLGFKEYAVALGYIEKSEICLIFTSGHPYESTTKIFDYLRMNKKVLIVSDVIPEDGSLVEIANNNQNVAWALNNEIEIAKALNTLLSRETEYEDTSRYSRKYGAIRLEELLFEI